MDINIFFANHHLRTPERDETLALMEKGMEFKPAMQKVADNWAESESNDESISVELEAFLYTNKELQDGSYDEELFPA